MNALANIATFVAVVILVTLPLWIGRGKKYSKDDLFDAQYDHE